MSIAIPEYFTEDQKRFRLKRKPWTNNDCQQIHKILCCEKGYYMNCVIRIGADGKWHDAWQVERKDMPVLVEMLFRQRIPVEIQAEGHGKASIIFVYNTRASQIISSLPQFLKNPKEGHL